MARSLPDRLIHELRTVRRELKETLAEIPDSELDYAPAPSMKSYRKLLEEVGAMLVETLVMVTEGRVPRWKECEARIQGDTFETIVASMDAALDELVAFIAQGPSDRWSREVEIPDLWEKYFGTTSLEPEELIRWVARHEYYHHGQIVSYRWIQGFNPYEN